MRKITKIINICFCLALASLFACKEAPKNSAPSDQPGVDQVDPKAELAAITDVVHNFYKWYVTFTGDEKRNVNYLDMKSKVTKLDNAKVAVYHAELMKSGFLSKSYIDHDLAELKNFEAIWQKGKENVNEFPITGMDRNRVFCGQDWDTEAFTTRAIQAEALGTNQVKVAIEHAELELIKENGKWLISKITCN